MTISVLLYGGPLVPRVKLFYFRLFKVDINEVVPLNIFMLFVYFYEKAKRNYFYIQRQPFHRVIPRIYTLLASERDFRFRFRQCCQTLVIK